MIQKVLVVLSIEYNYNYETNLHYSAMQPASRPASQPVLERERERERDLEAMLHATILEGTHRSHVLLTRRAKVIRLLHAVRHEGNPADGPK
jgi:hypothetical protein